MKTWIRKKLRTWLGVEHNERKNNSNEAAIRDIVSIGVDVHFKSPHMILVYSRVGGGQIREIPFKCDNMKELNGVVQELKQRFRTDFDTWDLPHGMHRF
jgi:hypothetical protein